MVLPLFNIGIANDCYMKVLVSARLNDTVEITKSTTTITNISRAIMSYNSVSGYFNINFRINSGLLNAFVFEQPRNRKAQG